MGDFRVVRRSPRPTRQAAIRWNARRQRLLGGAPAQTVGLTGEANGNLTITDETIYPIFENFDPDAEGAGPADGIGGVVVKDNNGKTDPKIKISNLKGRYGDKSWLGLINTELFDGSGNFDECAEFMWINRPTTAHTDFTIEAWIFPFDAHDTDYRPIMCGGTLETTGSFSTNSGSFWLRGQDLGFNVNTTTLVSANDVVPFNQWSHVAISRSSGTNRLYVNGVQVATAVNSTSWQWDGGKAFIGSGPCANATGIGAVRPFYGFMDDVVFHDSAVYTTTPVDVPASYADYAGQLASTITFPPIEGTHLFHFDADFADSFGATTGTGNSNGGEVVLSPLQWRFGGQSMKITNPSFTDTGDNYFNTGIDLGTGAFSIDFWMYCDFAAGNAFDIAVCGGRAGGGDGAHNWGLRFRDSVDDEWELDHTGVGAAVVSNTEGTSPLGGWAHVAIWRGAGDDADGNSLKWRILLPDYDTGATGEQNDGNWWASSTAGFHTANFGTLVFGGDNSDRDASSLYIDEVRVVLGTEAETMWRCEDPPLTRLEPYRTTNANPFFSKVKAQVDVVGGAITERVWNAASYNDSTGLWEEDGGELSVDLVETKSGNGSIKFDQSDTALAQGRNYVQVSNRLEKQYNVLPQEAYTLECWCRPKDWVSGTDSGTMRRMHIFGFADDWGDQVGTSIGVYINAFEVPAVVIEPSEYSNSGGTAMTPDTWHHVAVVRDEGPEGNHRIYLDGTLHHSFTYAGEVNLDRFDSSKNQGYNPHMYIGAAAGGINNTPYDFYGNIEGVMFTVGESKYVADFTPAVSNPAPQATAPAPSDELFASVEALIRPKSDRTAALVDVSNNAYTITQSAGSLATSDDAFKRHTTGHNSCVNISGVSQITPVGADSQFTDFTIEHLGWIYSASGLNQGWFQVGTSGSLGHLRCQMDTNTPEHIDIMYRNSLDTADIVARFEIANVISTFDTGEFIHLVVQRDGNYPAVALNGTWLPDDLTRDANDQLPATLGVSGGTWDIIGCTTSSNQPFWTEGVRFTKANRYTVGTNFTKLNERFPES